MCLFISHIFLSQVLFLVKAWKYICQQKSHLIRATLSQNKNFIRKTRQTKICLVTVTMHLRGCPYSLWSCNKVLTGRGVRKYLCAQGEMSNLYLSALICCWSMKSMKCFAIRNMFWIWHADLSIVEINSRYLTFSVIPLFISPIDKQ